MIWGFAVAAALTLDDAADAVDRGDGAAAVSILAPLAAEGTLSASGWYDLGLAHLRMGKAPEAVAVLRRAVALRPRNGDTLAALALARSRLVDPVPRPVPTDVLAWFATPTEAVIGGGLVAAAAGWIAVFRSVAWAAVWALGMLSVASGLWAQQRAVHSPTVVVLETVLLRDAPRDDGSVLGTWNPGLEGRRVEERGAWWLVEDGNGKRGWVPGAVFH